MRLPKIILRSIAGIAGAHSAILLRKFLRSHQNTAQVQDQLLSKLVRAHAETEFGRDFGLSSVRTYEDFCKAVPVATYDRYQHYVDRMLDGDTNALLPAGQKPLMFSMTSGTTAKPKYIPVTEQFLAETRRTWNAFGYNMLKQQLDAWVRPILQVTSLMRETDSPTGVPCGAISGLMTATQKKIVRLMYVVPPWVAEVTEPANRFYSIIRSSIAKDVSWITTANPSTVLKIIETAQQYSDLLIRDIADGTFTLPDGSTPPAVKNAVRPYRRNPKLAHKLAEDIRRDGHLRPEHFWNLSFLANWTGGTLRLYVDRLREYFPTQPIYDIGLIASEGRFSVPLRPDTPAGVAEITSNFLEFMPIEERSSQTPQTLRAHELEIGQEYFLVFSNWTGFLRYNLDDRVRVTGFYGQTPEFEFLCRGLHTANITGEKLTEHQVVRGMDLARAQLALNVERFSLQGVFADQPYYKLTLEDLPADIAEKIAASLDRQISNLNMEYASKRQSARLGPIRPCVLQKGEFDRLEREKILKRRGRSEQYKHQYLLTEIIERSQAT